MGHVDFKQLTQRVHETSKVEVALSNTLARRLRQRFYAWRRQQRGRGDSAADNIEATMTPTGVTFAVVSTVIEDAVQEVLNAER